MQKRFAGLRSRWTMPSDVRVGDGLAGLQDEVDRLLDGQRAALLQPTPQVAALEVLHDHVRGAVVELARRR